MKRGKVVVAVSEDFYCPTNVVNLWGAPTKAKNELSWNPQATSSEDLVKIMVTHLAEYLEKGIVK